METLDKARVRKLTQLKEDVERAQESYQRAKGKLEALLQQLKRDFGFDSVEDADEAMKKMAAELHRREALLAKRIDELAKKYPWGWDGDD